ncbi:MAG: methylenetetrahydrofolate reductase [NAD(P)H] [Candidatus Lindowbacteria bacterium RIFCSPLOWO2_12_FULL_62_27]|nr:MAG: methylenetetrahydrofolate reductase [NAD(P)H] [Candidatus Lindowbacteria bacterium RIFCSPLOWO2_02_FULL_62_12]OGH63090.1 MAG: methylenetetrahydrofolate reductase [NAD(P)H] [Candidatus Lindowbacteria bacterium RIFCSPLOWO2_12_FULL_62_27]
MRISEMLARDGRTFSFEFFPPKTPEGEKNLYETIEVLREHHPSFVSVTYGAGGSTRAKTVEIVSRIKNEIGIEAMAHLTCVGAARGEILSVLDKLKKERIENVLALRGDPPKGETGFTPHADGFRYASELVAAVREHDDFTIGVAGYPEGHVECESKEKDLENLKRKVDAGGEFIITQLFFDPKDYFDFVARARAIGIRVPIIPGIMPVTNFAQIQKFTQMCGAHLPAEMRAALEPIQHDPAQVQAFGVEYAVRQCQELLNRGAPGIHFYTLNKSPATRAIFSRLF